MVIPLKLLGNLHSYIVARNCHWFYYHGVRRYCCPTCIILELFRIKSFFQHVACSLVTESDTIFVPRDHAETLHVSYRSGGGAGRPGSSRSRVHIGQNLPDSRMITHLSRNIPCQLQYVHISEL